MTETSDIAIVGGGLVGLCAALVLQHPSRRVDVIEAGSPGREKSTGLNTRSIALSWSSVQIFRALNLWSELKPEATAIRDIHVSARGRWGVTRLRADDFELDALGYVVENDVLSECLLTAVSACEGINLLDESEFESISQADTVEIGFRRKRRKHKLQARLGLIADGANSQARDALEIGHQRVNYGQAVIICNVEVSAPMPQTAYERFTPEGPLAMLPLGEKRYACVWTLDPDQAEVLGSHDDVDFIDALQTCFGMRLGYIEAVGARFTMPLERVRADRLYHGRCVLIGNAANALHPVAGQSFNLSLRDIACLHEILVDLALPDLDDDNIVNLMAAYAQTREQEQQRVIRYGDGLVSLFSNHLPLVGQVRAAGLSLLDVLPALKTQVAFAGMGLTYGGNRLLRGRL